MLKLISELKEKLNTILNEKYSISNPKAVVTTTANLSFGDLTTNVPMVYAKKLGRKPLELAEEILSYLESSSNYKTSVASPGYINFTFTPEYLAENLKDILLKKERYGKTNVNIGVEAKTVVVEFSSPNIAKPFGIGHLRSTIIGDSIAKLLTFNGFRVLRDNHLGDWGTQFGKLIYAIKNWSDLERIKNSDSPIKDLFNLYVRFHKEAESDPELNQKGRDWFKKLESGDKEARGIWKTCVDLSLKEFNRIYDVLDVNFDMMLGESFYEDKMREVIEELDRKKLLTESKGAQLVFFSKDKYPPLMILKNDGTTLYATRDLATDRYRFDEWGNDILIINEVGAEQSLYFRQLFEIEQMLDWCEGSQRIHLKHGHYRFKDRKMSTRKGDIIWLDNLVSQAVKKASDFNKDVALDVAIAAIKWNDLKAEIIKDVIFDWDEVLSLKGNTGPYVQYTYARCSSLLGKSGIEEDEIHLIEGASQPEMKLIRTFIQFPLAVKMATENLTPHHICNFLLKLSQEYNSYYDSGKIIGSDREDMGIALTKATLIILKTGLNLLGIKELKRI